MTEAATVDIGTAEREALGRLIGSLADNKAALGRRYGEWAVSAPTLESAVAAAAMAQDELGHARATYPLLKQLGVAVREDEERLELGDCLPLLADELPSWPTFVAVNLVIDGMLTAFVRASQDSAFVPLAQRARKILQEEGSHAVHARAWARRLARDDAHREEFAAELRRAWEQASTWPDDPGFAALTAGGYVIGTPDSLREDVLDLVDEALPEPAAPECPECSTTEQVTLVSRFGGQIITAQWRCNGCNSYFEAVRDDFSGTP
jgi:ring-1,2-phenylacetyl-CoA epoxidase subunit PaaC